MLIAFEAADLNLDFLSVRIFCSTLARTDNQETLLILDLVLQSDKMVTLLTLGSGGVETSGLRAKIKRK